MSATQPRLAIVTGNAIGIGAAFTKELLKHNMIVVGLDIQTDKMQQLRDSLPTAQRSRLHNFTCDLNVREQVDAVFEQIDAQLGGIHILINNAGLHISKRLLEIELDEAQLVMQTNVMQVVHCTQLAVQSMRKHKIDGNIILMNSISGHKVLPMNVGVRNLYMPGKQALTAINEVLRQELYELGTGIRVTNLCPGLVVTEMVPPEVQERMKGRMLCCDDVVKTLMFILSMPPRVQVHDIIIKALGEIN